MQWKEVLKYELGEQKGAILAAVLLGEKSRNKVQKTLSAEQTEPS